MIHGIGRKGCAEALYLTKGGGGKLGAEREESNCGEVRLLSKQRVVSPHRNARASEKSRKIFPPERNWGSLGKGAPT